MPAKCERRVLILCRNVRRAVQTMMMMMAIANSVQPGDLRALPKWPPMLWERELKQPKNLRCTDTAYMEQKQASHSLAAKKAPKNMIRNKVARVWPRVAAVSGEPSESHATCSFAVNERASRRGMKCRCRPARLRKVQNLSSVSLRLNEEV